MKKCFSGCCIIALIALGGACNSKKKATDCKVLVVSMTELSEKLAEARKVLSARDAEPNQVAEALKPFSVAAKNVAVSLNTKVPTVSSLRKISSNAAAAALALSSQSAQMAEYAEQMKDMEAANKAVDENKQRMDQLELQIKGSCEAESSKCIDLSKVLARFPAPTDQTEVADDVAVWARKLSTWTAELEKVDIPDQQLKVRVQAFTKGWQERGISMSRLVTILEIGKKYEALNKALNDQLDRANQAIANANAACQK